MGRLYRNPRLFRQGFSRRTLLRGGAATGLGFASLPLVGCGNDDDDDGNDNGNGADPTQANGNGTDPTQANGNGDPQAGGTWQRGAGANISLEGLPYIWAGNLYQGGNAALRFQGLIWGTLVRPSETESDFEPDHAESWEWSEDRESITFTLREDIEFHSGRQFTAEDVAFNLDQIEDPRWETGHAARLNPVDNYEVVDDFTIRLNLVRPDALALEFANTLLIADRESIDDISDGVLVGTGAFEMDSYSAVQGATLVANPNYHLGAPLLDSIEYTIYDDPAALAIALESGEIHDSQLAEEEAQRHYDSGDFNVVELPPTGGVIPIGMRADIPPTDNKLVRQAIGMLLDRERYQDEGFLGARGQLGRLYWSPDSPAYDAELDEPIYDPQRASDLLAEAGFADGLPDPVVINTLPPRPYSPAIAQLLQQEGQDVGIDFQFEPLDYDNMLDRYYAGDLDNMWVGFGDSGSILSPGASLLFNTLTDGAVCNYDDPDYLAAWDDLASGGDDYDTYNELFIDGAFNHVLERPVGVNFERDSIHYTRDFMGQPVWHKMWVSE